jgi:hypothetical protein
MDGATVYGFLLFGKTCAAGTITSSSTLAGLAANEENGTAYARTSLVLSADANGIQSVPSYTLNPANAVDWHTTASAVGIASAASGGFALYFWDLIGGPYDMSVVDANLQIPSVNYFFENPGGI